MFLGHYSTALIPLSYQDLSNKREALLVSSLFFVATQIQDYVMYALVGFGIEQFGGEYLTPTPLSMIEVHVPYSHSLLSSFFISIFFAAIVYFTTKRFNLALVSFVLSQAHEFLDFLVGFSHFIAPNSEVKLGLNLYHESLLTGLVIELLITTLCILFFWTKKRSGIKDFPFVNIALLWVVLVVFGIALIPISI